MSRKPSDHENLKPDGALDEFETALAALRPRVDQSQSRTEFVPFQRGSGAILPACERAAGHEFVCLHCGIDAPRIIRRRRWAWPAALTAMTSAAAILLVMLLADRTARIAERENKPNEQGAAAVSITNKPDVTQKRIDSGRETDMSRRIAVHSRGEPWILSAADIELRNDVLASRDGSNSGASASFADGETAASRLSNGALTRRLLREYGAAGRPVE